GVERKLHDPAARAEHRDLTANHGLAARGRGGHAHRRQGDGEDKGNEALDRSAAHDPFIGPRGRDGKGRAPRAKVAAGQGPKKQRPRRGGAMCEAGSGSAQAAARALATSFLIFSARTDSSSSFAFARKASSPPR